MRLNLSITSFSTIIFGMIATTSLKASENHCDLQLFGDFFISEAALTEISAQSGKANPFGNTEPLLKTCHKNIINFEGVATDQSTPFESKEFLLKMPLWTPALLKENRITIFTLANNHSMDFGLLGLRDTLSQAAIYGIETLGAHELPIRVLKPLRFQIGTTSLFACLGAFSSTFPKSFWADEYRGGTAYASPINIRKTFSYCLEDDFKIAIFHWGEERNPHPHDLQKSLAENAIDSGVDLVVGHHPHVLQPISIYQGKPIFYSLGNYVFASRPVKSAAEGMSLRLTFSNGKRTPDMLLVPLNVRNDMVHFNPRGFKRSEFEDASKAFKHLLNALPKFSMHDVFYHEEWGWSYRLFSNRLP